MPPGTRAHVERLRKLERDLARVRWFGIALGIYEVVAYTTPPDTAKPRSTDPIAYIALWGLLVANAVVMLAMRREPDERALARIGAAVFLCDMAAVWTMTWAYNFEHLGVTWVLLSIMCLEGALRYRLRGAMLPVLLAIPVETIREWFNHVSFGFPFVAGNLIFRIGFLAMIGSVSGVMSRNLWAERAEADRRAEENEALAALEHQARNESNAFQDVILAGVSESGLHEALTAMLEAISETLGYRALAVLLLDGETLRPAATFGLPAIVEQRSLPIGEGISGSVARSGFTEIVDDVRTDPRYYDVEPTTRSQIALPIRAGDAIIGVLDVESPELAAFSRADASRLERLCTQIGLVIDKARLLAQERETIDRMRELELMKADFIAIASHELRTPLTAMQGTIKTLRRPDFHVTPEQSDELLATIDRQSDRLARLVEDLLLVSRIDASGVTLSIDPTDLRDVFADVMSELGARAARVSLAIAADLPRFQTDGQRLGQIARNLIENALKFSSPEHVVRVTVHADPSPKMLLLEVADEGHGIPEEELPRIFERFHQVGGSLRRRSDGFGLGLYITRRLVDALGGKIEVESVVGEGTTFRVSIPETPSVARAAGIA